VAKKALKKSAAKKQPAKQSRPAKSVRPAKGSKASAKRALPARAAAKNSFVKPVLKAAAKATAVLKSAVAKIAAPTTAKSAGAKSAAAAKPTQSKLSFAKPNGKAPPAPVGKLAGKSSPSPKSAPPPPAKPAPRPVMAKPEKKPFNNPPPPLAPVPTDGKPRKNQAGMHVRELEHFRELLLSKRRELVGDMSQMEREALRSASGSNLSNLPLHMADMGTDNYEQEFTLGLVEKERNLLREINQALAKIQDGSYGICEGTGKPISKARLEAQPWARFSIEHARKMERGFFR
jgi:RNA polymerase-binding protein DksA